MINQEGDIIQPNQLLKFIGVSVFMFWFLMQLESSVSIFLRYLAIYPPFEINYSLAYILIEFFVLILIFFLFNKFLKNIKANYQNQSYLKKTIILFIIGVVLLNSIMFILPFHLLEFLKVTFEFNESSEKPSVQKVKTIALVVSFIIKIVVFAYFSLKNTNFQNSSTSF
ncbi:hypothetical protein V9L05_23460 (plasmid) [Bernardetia sp. Wsw4-3y2]|uniref:hypothetical protein n=1 Tax=Bernardetia sp. Wsw4-3y2 TaxID=3127471 RepID=UPI0030CD1A38